MAKQVVLLRRGSSPVSKWLFPSVQTEHAVVLGKSAMLWKISNRLLQAYEDAQEQTIPFLKWSFLFCIF